VNNEFINHHRPERNGRNHAGYGNTPRIEFEESRSPLFWGLAMITGLIALAVGINAFCALLDGGVS
jgi:hypothetical protein